MRVEMSASKMVAILVQIMARDLVGEAELAVPEVAAAKINRQSVMIGGGVGVRSKTSITAQSSAPAAERTHDGGTACP